jgi:hypothetical protein
MTIVPDPVCVPNACAKRVSSFGVSDWPTTPRTPEMLIFRVGIARIVLKKFLPQRRNDATGLFRRL